MATRRDANAIARSPNRLTDSVFVGALSENDSVAVATLIADHFCRDSDSGIYVMIIFV